MLQLLDASNWDGDGKRTAIVLSLDDRPRNLADKEIRLNPKITYGKIILKIIEHFDNEEQKQCDVKPTTRDKATNQHVISSELLTKPPNLSLVRLTTKRKISSLMDLTKRSQYSLSSTLSLKMITTLSTKQPSELATPLMDLVCLMKKRKIYNYSKLSRMVVTWLLRKTKFKAPTAPSVTTTPITPKIADHIIIPTIRTTVATTTTTTTTVTTVTESIVPYARRAIIIQLTVAKSNEEK